MNNNLIDNHSSEFDIDLNNAMRNGLCWLPWIGKYYNEQAIKILVVGESHYASNKNRTEIQKDCDVDRVADDKDFTRAVIYESRIMRWWSNTTYDNVNFALTGRNNFDGRKLWNKIAFYNFIQRPMRTVNERPLAEEFAAGWRNFVDVVKVIKPSICIFIGNSAANFFNEAMATLNVQYTPAKGIKFVNGAWAKHSSLTIDDYTLHIHSIRHAGRFFSWGSWNEYLHGAIPEAMSFLKAIISDTSPDVESNDEIYDEQTERIHTADMPTWLSHKPIIACNYRMVNPDDYNDAQYISVGRAQYDPNDASVKIFRHSGNRWSRQSEEVPIQRLGYMLEMLLIAILQCQRSGEESFRSELLEEIIAPEDMDFLREQIMANRHSIRDSLNRIKALIEEINPEKI